MIYKKGWYWVTAVSEGDIWYPVYIRGEDFILDGKSKNLSELKDLIVKQAVMPEDEQKLQSKIKELEQQLTAERKRTEVILKHARDLIDFELISEFEDRIAPSEVSDD